MNLHGQIMNLSCDTPRFGRTTTKHYKEGHRDARHAAAELALAADAEIERLRAALLHVLPLAEGEWAHHEGLSNMGVTVGAEALRIIRAALGPNV
jgi:hypothetical protein